MIRCDIINKHSKREHKIISRSGAARQLVGLITRRSQVQILPPQPKQNQAIQEIPKIYFPSNRFWLEQLDKCIKMLYNIVVTNKIYGSANIINKLMKAFTKSFRCSLHLFDNAVEAVCRPLQRCGCVLFYLNYTSFFCNCQVFFCRCGEIGRHKGLKIPRQRYRTGSSPVSGTRTQDYVFTA